MLDLAAQTAIVQTQEPSMPIIILDHPSSPEDRVQMRQLLMGLCETFSQSYPEISDAVRVEGTCEYFSHAFVKHTTIPTARVLHLLGYQTERPHRCASPYPNPDPDQYHVVALFPHNICVDITARQFNSTGPIYEIGTLEDLAVEWYMLADTWEHIELFLNLRSLVKEELQEGVQRTEFTKMIITLDELVKKGMVVFTQPHDTNLHYQRFKSIERMLR